MTYLKISLSSSVKPMKSKTKNMKFFTLK